MKSIILLSGPVGAGKSTVAQALIKLLPGPVSYIEGDKFWAFFVKDAPRKNRIKNFKIIMKAMAAAAMPFAMADNQVIVDFSIPPWFLDTVYKILKFRKIPVDYVVLLPTQTTCAARAASRTEGKITDYTEYEELYQCFTEAERYTIDDDVSSPEELATIIYDGLKAGFFRVAAG